jgi:hypothetical protein
VLLNVQDEKKPGSSPAFLLMRGLLQKFENVLRDGVCLRQHGGASLLKNLGTRQCGCFSSEVGIANA